MRISNLLFLLIFFTASFSHSQISGSDQKKIEKIIGQGFKELTPSKKYHFYPQTSGLIVDTSTTFKDDTIGLVFNNEYIMFHDLIASRKSKEVMKYLAQEPVTVGEYQEFKNYVCDSIARMKLYFNLEEDEEAHQFLKCEKWFLDGKGKKQEVDPSDRYFNWEYFSLNWNKQFKYDDPNYVPILADLYLGTQDRFRKQRLFDERKLNYIYTEKIDSLIPDRDLFKSYQAFRIECSIRNVFFDMRVSISNDNDFWAKSAKHIFDEGSVLAQLYPKIKDENPVVGLLGTQAKAFCHWKQEQVQKELDKAKIPFTAVVTLPEKNDLRSVVSASDINVSAFDYTENWQISQMEYSQFIDHVIDSMSRMELYFNLELHDAALKLINYESIYFEEGALEFVDLDFTQREINLELFPLNFKTKIDKKDPEVKQILDNLKASNRSYFKYVYSSIQPSGMARKYDGPFTLDENGKYGNDKSFNYHIKNKWDYRSGVRCIENYGEFIEMHRFSIFPKEIMDIDGESEALISWLTYEQALAFYNWKYRIDKFNPEKEDWQQFIFPSEEQFNTIQKGESIVIPEHEVEFPTPLFRYVVHIFPKD